MLLWYNLTPGLYIPHQYSTYINYMYVQSVYIFRYLLAMVYILLTRVKMHVLTFCNMPGWCIALFGCSSFGVILQKNACTESDINKSLKSFTCRPGKQGILPLQRMFSCRQMSQITTDLLLSCMIPPAHRNLKCSITAKLIAISRLGAALFEYTLCVLNVELKYSHLKLDKREVLKHFDRHIIYMHTLEKWSCLIYLSVLKPAVGSKSIIFSTKWRIRWTFVFCKSSGWWYFTVCRNSWHTCW